MASEAIESTGLIQFQAWVEQNKRRILILGGSALAAILLMVAYLNIQTQKENAAAGALSEVRMERLPDGTMQEPSSAEFLRVANEYPGTKAGARALLLGAGALFREMDYAQAQSRFESFLSAYPDNPLAGQAAYGVAASFEAQGNTDAAIIKFEELRRIYPNQPVSDQAHLVLGRLYEDTDRLEEAYAIYEEISSVQSNFRIGSEASMRMAELAKSHPELVKTNEPPATSSMLGSPNALMGATNLVALTNLTPVAGTNVTPAMVTNLPVTAPTPSPEAASTPPAIPGPAPDANPNSDSNSDPDPE